MPWAEGWWHTYKMDLEHFADPSLSVIVAKCWFLWIVVWDRTYVFSIYYNPNLEDWIFDCSLFPVQADYMCASFLFVGDLNGCHLEWFCSTATNRHGVAVFDFAIVSGCDQLVDVVEHLTSSWLMFLTSYRLSLWHSLVTQIAPLCRLSLCCPLGMFPLFLKITDVLGPHLSVVFCQLVYLSSFPVCWRHAHVTPILKGSLSSPVDI